MGSFIFRIEGTHAHHTSPFTYTFPFSAGLQAELLEHTERQLGLARSLAPRATTLMFKAA